MEITAFADGSTVSLDQIEGPAVVNLWATWCPPCRGELPEFQQVHESRDDVTFVGINVGEDPVIAQEFLNQIGVTYDQYGDQLNLVLAELGTTGMPTTVIVDVDGKIASTHVGALTGAQLTAAIDAALAG